MKKLTLNIADIVQLVENDGIFEYKTSQIDRIHGMYSAKTFSTIGDSTQIDPETYGEA
jgi:phosphatidate phosphatase APP1